MGLSLSHLLLVLVIVLLIFGAGKLPQIMGDLAKGLKAFKAGLGESEGDPAAAPKAPRKKPKSDA